uniref:Uncharacterized protein n=1 Tax=Cucumis melo TaxID=3656 RepID=A0A9I9EKA6_CUCME
MVAEEVSILITSNQCIWWVGTSLLPVAVLFEMSMTVDPELFKGREHLMLNKAVHCLIIEIKHKQSLHITNITH